MEGEADAGVVVTQDLAAKLRSVMAVGRDELQGELFLEDEVDGGWF